MSSLLSKLPDELYKLVYSYVFDLTEIKRLKNKYVYYKNDDFRYYYENRIIINNSYFWTQECIYFPTIVSCFWFDKGYYDTGDFDKIYDNPIYYYLIDNEMEQN